MKFVQAHFRGRLYKGYIMNIPYAFNMIFKIVSVFLDKRTLMKIQITSSSKNDGMLTHIHKDQLEKRFGGNRDQPEDNHYW